MIFLIDYHRKQGKILAFRQFADSQRDEADAARSEIERSLNGREADREVVVLEAESESDLRKSHRRYFESLREMLDAAIRQFE